ncbi:MULTISPECIES: FxsA family protein [unclassified Acinetobacter]|uniref:FxsA family protein n=1 Tax=unclassified Acinetobacter TaxID=196816 RepID=UPI0035B9C269
MGIILAVLIAIVVEILTWIVVGKWLGSGWYVFFWFIAAFFIGLAIVKKNSKDIMPQLQQMQMGGAIGMGAVGEHTGKKLAMMVAGLLLAIPGLWTDLFAVLLLLPPVQNALKGVAMTAMQKRQQAMMEKMMGGMGGGFGGANMGGMGGGNPLEEMMRQMQQMQRGGAANDPTIIDGEAKEVKSNAKRIDAPKK